MFEITRCKVVSIASANHREVIDYGVRMVGAPLEWKETMGEGVKVGIIGAKYVILIYSEEDTHIFDMQIMVEQKNFNF